MRTFSVSNTQQKFILNSFQLLLVVNATLLKGEKRRFTHCMLLQFQEVQYIITNYLNNFFFWILYNYFFCHICVQRIYPEEAGVGRVFPQLAGHIQIACQLQINTEESEPWPGLARTGLGTFCIINKIKTMLGTLRLLLPGFRSSWIKHPSARNLTGSIYSTE